MRKTNKKVQKEEMRDVTPAESFNSIPNYPAFTFHGLSKISINDSVSNSLIQSVGENSNLFPAIYNINAPTSDVSLCLTEQEYNLLKEIYKDDAKSIENFEKALRILMNLKYLSYVQSNGFMIIRINLLGCIKHFDTNTITKDKMFINRIFDWDAFKEILQTTALFGYLKMKSNFYYTGNKIPYLNIELCGITDLKEHLIDSKINMNDGLMYLYQEFKDIYNKKNESFFGDNRFQITEEVIRSMDKLIELCLYKYAEMTIYNDLEMYCNLVDKKTITETFYDEKDVIEKIDEDIKRTMIQAGSGVDCSYVNSKSIPLSLKKLILNEPLRKSRDFKHKHNDYFETFLSVVVNDYWRYSPYTSFFYRENLEDYEYFNRTDVGYKQYLIKTKDYLENHIRFSDIMNNTYSNYIDNKIGKKNNQSNMDKVKFRFNVTFNRQLLSNYYYSNLFTKNILNKLDNKTMSSFRMSINNELLHNPLFSAVMARLVNTNELGTEQEHSSCLSKKSIYSNRNAISLSDNDEYVFSDDVNWQTFKQTYENPFLSDIDDDDLISTFFTLISLELIVNAAFSPYERAKKVTSDKEIDSETVDYLKYAFNKLPRLPLRDCFNKHNMTRKISDIIWNGTSSSKNRPLIAQVGFKQYFDTLIRSNSYYNTDDCHLEAEEGIDTVFKLRHLTDRFDDSDWFKVVVLNFRNLVTKLHKSYISYISHNLRNEHGAKNRKTYEGTAAVSNKLFHINNQLNKILDYLEDHGSSVIHAETRDVAFIKSLLVSIANLYSEFEPNGWLFTQNFNGQRYKNLYLNNVSNKKSKAKDEKVVRLDFLAIGDSDYRHIDANIYNKTIEYEKRISVECFYSTKVDSNHHISKLDSKCNPYKVHQSEYMLDRIKLNYVNATEENFDDIRYLKKLERTINILLNNTLNKKQFGSLLFEAFKNNIVDDNGKGFKNLTIDKTKWVLMYFNDTFVMNIVNKLLPLSIGSLYANIINAASKTFKLEEKTIELENDFKVKYDKFEGYVSFKSLLWELLYNSYIDDVSYPISKSNKYIEKTIELLFNNFGRKIGDDYIRNYEDKYFGPQFRFYAYDFSIAAYPYLNRCDGVTPYNFFCDSLEHIKPYSLSDIEKYSKLNETDSFIDVDESNVGTDAYVMEKTGE